MNLNLLKYIYAHIMYTTGCLLILLEVHLTRL